MIFEGFCSGSLESYQLYLSLWLINYCKIELGKAFCYQLYSGPTAAPSVYKGPVGVILLRLLLQIEPAKPGGTTLAGLFNLFAKPGKSIRQIVQAYWQGALGAQAECFKLLKLCVREFVPNYLPQEAPAMCAHGFGLKGAGDEPAWIDHVNAKQNICLGSGQQGSIVVLAEVPGKPVQGAQFLGPVLQMT